MYIGPAAEVADLQQHELHRQSLHSLFGTVHNLRLLTRRVVQGSDPTAEDA